MQKYGGDPDVPNLDALKQKFVFRDFPHFIDTWIWKNGFLRTYEDFTFIAEAVARDLASQNVRYVEAFYSPSDFRASRPAYAGTDIGHPHRPRPRARDRNRPRRRSRSRFRTGKRRSQLAEFREVHELGVIGIGIGGSEQLHPPEPFADVYERARELGFHTSAHAGEAAGAESVWGAIRALHVERIGHGTRADEDPALLDYLAKHAIPLEMCPLSNVRTGVVESIEKHPVRRYFKRGILVTVNTDDPKMFGNRWRRSTRCSKRNSVSRPMKSVRSFSTASARRGCPKRANKHLSQNSQPIPRGESCKQDSQDVLSSRKSKASRDTHPLILSKR